MKTNLKKYLLKNRKKYYIAQNINNLSEDNFIDSIASAIKMGANIVEYKNQNNPSQMLLIARKIQQICSIYDVLFMINDRIDIAQIIKPDGVFLNSNSLAIDEVKKLLDDEILIGDTNINSNSDFSVIDYNYKNLDINKPIYTKKEMFYEVSNDNFK